MMRLLAISLLFSFCQNSLALETRIIKSKVLGYNLRYWVHVPKDNSEPLPVLYVTDGKWYKEGGGIIETSIELINKKQVEPHIIVLVDAFNPDNPGDNRRNNQFLCNPDYVEFYKRELIPEIDTNYKTIKSREARAMLGLSFGGLNSMYFALHANDVFSKIGIQSPAPHPCPDIYDDFEKAGKLDLDIFLSTGTVNDKATATRRLKKILDAQGYDFKYIEVAEGHNWKNWKPMLDDILFYFYAQ